jgi:hypothetical protein
MATAVPLVPLELGQLVRHHTDLVDRPTVGAVGGLVFGDSVLVLVRWEGAPFTFEVREDLVAVRRAA